MHLRPYVWQLLGRLLPQVLALIVSAVVVRNAGVAVVGQQAIALAITAISAGLLAASFDTHYLRLPQDTTASEIVGAKWITWIMAMPVIGAGLWLFDVPVAGGLAIYAAVGLLQVSETYSVAARLNHQDRYAVVPRVVPPAVFLCALLVVRPSDLNGIAGLFLVSWTLVLTLVPREVFQVNWREPRRMFKTITASRRIIGTLLFTQIYGNADLFVIRANMNHMAVGEYKIAQAIAAAIMPTIAAVTFVYLSRIRNVIASRDLARTRRLLYRQLVLHASIGACVFFTMLALLPWGVPMIFGAKAAGAIPPAIILTGAAALNGLGMVFVYTLFGFQQDHTVLIGTGLAAIGNVLLNIVLVPLYGISGAAWASVFTFSFSGLLFGILVRKKLFDLKAEQDTCLC